MTVRGLGVVLLVLLAVGASGLVFWRCEGEAPQLVAPEALVVGSAGAAVEITASDARSGLRRLRVTLRHAGGEAVLFERDPYPGEIISGAPFKPSEERVKLALDPEALGLPEGDAFLDVEVADWSWASLFSGNVTSLSIPVSVDLSAPRVYVENGLTYVRRGGAAAVVYTVDEPAARDGVEVGHAFYPGFPFPDAAGDADLPQQGAGRRFALFAVGRNASKGVPIQVVAVDAAGNRTATGWDVRIQEREFEDVRINLSDRFLSSKVPSLAAATRVDAAEPVAAFQKINSDVRAADEIRVQEIVAESSTRPYWSGAFEQLRNSAVTSRFAEHRSYFVKDRQVSEAIHYGYDLASTAKDSITASNAGRVIFAGDLGIYGNCVVLDHGLGLTSLYAHLSRIDVAPGDEVPKGQSLGLSGATGLAGGDHLHFAILVNGTYVDPKEWWDPKWVREHVDVHLAAPSE